MKQIQPENHPPILSKNLLEERHKLMQINAPSPSDLPLRIEHLVQEQIATGRFQTAEEVLVEALETLRDFGQLAEPVRGELRQRDQRRPID